MHQNPEPWRKATKAETRITTLSQEENFENNWTELKPKPDTLPSHPKAKTGNKNVLLTRHNTFFESRIF
jgi:hypothetical protein